MSYGTVLVARVKPGAEEELRDGGRRWVEERAPVVRGFEDEWVLFGDDGTVVMAVRFASKEAYEKLADDPAQDAFYQEHLGPYVEDIRWIDGQWEPLVSAAKAT
jgi:hypothetical protein